MTTRIDDTRMLVVALSRLDYTTRSALVGALSRRRRSSVSGGGFCSGELRGWSRGAIGYGSILREDAVIEVFGRGGLVVICRGFVWNRWR